MANAFVSGWVSRWDISVYVVTDRCAQYEGELFSSLSQVIGLNHVRITSYNLQSIDIIERFHRVLKVSIIARE